MERSHISNLIAQRNRVGCGEVVGGNNEGEIVDRMEKMFQWNLLCASVIIKIRKKEWRKDREKENFSPFIPIMQLKLIDSEK